jgi:hypothetical protein
MNKRLGEATAASVALPVGPFANAQDHSQLNLVPSASGIVPLTIPPPERKEIPTGLRDSLGGYLLLVPIRAGSLQSRSGPRRPLGTRQTWYSSARTWVIVAREKV